MTALKWRDKIKCMQEKGKWSWWSWSQSGSDPSWKQGKKQPRLQSFRKGRREHCGYHWTVQHETAGEQRLSSQRGSPATIHFVCQLTGPQGAQIFDHAWFWGFYEVSLNGISIWIGRLANADGCSYCKWPHPISWRSIIEHKSMSSQSNRESSCLEAFKLGHRDVSSSWIYSSSQPSDWNCNMSATDSPTSVITTWVNSS